MRYSTFFNNTRNAFQLGIIIKEPALADQMMVKHYVDPLRQRGIAGNSIIALGLDYNKNNKCPVALAKEQLNKIGPTLIDMGITHLLVADPVYFKVLTKLTKTEPHHGYVKKAVYPGYENIDVVLSVNYQALFHNPDVQAKLTMSIDTVADAILGQFNELGQDVIREATYCYTKDQLENFLHTLLKKPALTCDIETRGLLLNQAGIATIGFAWDQHNGGAAAIDRCDHTFGEYIERDVKSKMELYALLREFFEQYQGHMVYHNASFDTKIMIVNLFMKHLQDWKGMIHGLDVMFRNIDDTQIITYLATNSTSGNTLGLKQNSFEYTGNYAQEEIHDTTRIPLPELLKYNLIDNLATWFVYNKYRPVMMADNQLQIHDEIFIPSLKVITKMELVGMPMNGHTLYDSRGKLEEILYHYVRTIEHSKIVQDYIWKRARIEMFEANLLLKKKVRPINDFVYPLNTGSPKQVGELVYEHMGFPVTDTSDGGAPATGNKTLKKYLNQLIETYDITEEELDIYQTSDDV